MKSLSNLDQLSKPELIELFKKLFEENKDLKQQNKALLEQNKALQRQNQALKAQVKTLEKRVEKLEAQLHQNSRNSSRAPSSDGPEVKKKVPKAGRKRIRSPKRP